MVTLRLLFSSLVMLAVASGQEPASSPYVGSETCQTCHEDIYNAFGKSPHHIVDTDSGRGWKGRACESCHGPAAKHAESASAEDIRNPGKLAAPATDKICLTCHLNEPTHVGRLQSSHAKNQVSCTTCHSVHAHGPMGLVNRRASAINQQCATCHTAVWAQFQKPFHHRLPEEAMSCTDCHNPHGSTRPAMGQTFAANEPGCFKCHGDKRGPFTFDHAPVRFEGCASCHEPHGSANPRMLTRQEVRFTCLECHANLPPQLNTNAKLGVVPPAFHNLLSPQFRNCTICHQKIHGSHVDRNLLR
ncbi:MAG: DmsE family decaheme c-type cytochrome [Acidobacteriota bacterium]|nr:DmsE family decaheme c-type cytochrome [Acidobacteriota bacterium]